MRDYTGREWDELYIHYINYCFLHSYMDWHVGMKETVINALVTSIVASPKKCHRLKTVYTNTDIVSDRVIPYIELNYISLSVNTFNINEKH